MHKHGFFGYLLIPVGLLLAAMPLCAEVYQPPDPEPTPVETLILELMNRFRADPVGEAARLNFTDDAGAAMKAMKPLPPLVMSLTLLDAARKHSHYMILNELTHVEDAAKPGFYGAGFGERAGKSGYAGFCGGENCFRDPGDAYGSHAGFAHSKGHRENMASGHREAGPGAVPHADGHPSVTHLFGSRSPRMVGGVAYQDTNGNKFYDLGEGIGGVRISASDGTGTVTWKAGSYALDLKSSGPVMLTAEFLGQKFTKQAAAGGENVKFDIIVPEALIRERVDKLLAAVDAVPDESPKRLNAVLALFMEARWLKLDPERQTRFNELTAKAGGELDAAMNAVRGALDPLDPAAFAKVLADARKPYSGTPADAWFRDASLLAAVKLRVLAFERQNAVQKASPQQRRQFAAEIESAEKQLATRAFSGDMTALIARARNPGAPQPAVARTAPPAAPPVAATNPPADTKVPATPAAPAVLPPAARAELPGSAAGLATWCGKLRERVIAGTKSGQKPTAYLALFGGKESAVTVVGADDKELLIEMGGGKLPVPWNKLDQRKDMLNLARAFAKEDAPADHLLKAVFLLVNGMNDEAEDAFLKALELKLPGGAEAVESARQSLKG